MSQPRISVYASSANGNAAPTRVIQGARTLQARTSHYIAVDSVHDELAVPNPFAQALIFLPGGADGDEPALRVIQGPKTMLSQPDNVSVDAAHDEVFTAQFTTDSVLVFRRDVGGDVAPIRVLHGPKTTLNRPIRVDVDPVNNLIAVVNDRAILIFNRTDNGDVAPKWVISGPKAGVGTSLGTRDVKLFAEGKKIIAGGNIRCQGGGRGNAATGGAGGQGGGRGGEGGGGFFGGGQRFIGVWNYGDTGDVSPWAMLNATPTTDIPGSRLAINPAGGDLIVGGDGQVSVYHLPEIFRRSN